MSDKTTGRLGWTGILVTEDATATASTSSGPHTGPAIPKTDAPGNLGTMTLRSFRVDRAAAASTVRVKVTKGGQALGQVPAEVVGYLGTDATPYGWMDPNTPWGLDRLGTSAVDSRFARWGGAAGWSMDYVDSNDLSITTAHDICPGADGQIVAAWIETTSVAYVLRCATYQRSLSTTTPVATSAQVIPLDVLAPSTHSLGRVRVAYRNGSAVLLLDGQEQGAPDKDRVYQWASSDGGASWTYIGSTESTAADSRHGLGDVEATDDGFLVAYGTGLEASESIRIAVLASPFSPFWAAPFQTIGSAMWDDSTAAEVRKLEVSLSRAETGEVYALALTYPASGVWAGRTYITRDGGGSWAGVLGSGGTVGWVLEDVATGDRPSSMDSTWCRGGIVWVGIVGAYRWRMRLGGWSQYAMTSPTWTSAAARRGYTLGATCQPDAAYMPWGDVPSASGWSVETNGAPTAALSGDHLRLTGTSAAREAETWYADGSEAALDPFVQWARFRVFANTTQVDHQAPAIVEFRACSGAKTYGVRVAIGNDTVRVYERTGATSYSALAAAESHGFTSKIMEWYVWCSFDFDTAKAYIYAVARDADTDPIALSGKAWTFSHEVENVTVTDIFAHETTSRVTWGSWLSSTGSEVADWYWMWIGASGAPGPAAPTAALVQGRPLSGPMVHILPDVLVQSAGGVAYDSDAWDIATAYDGAAAHVTSPDPGLAWSSGTLTSETLTVTLATPIPGPLVGVVLRGLVSEAILVEVQNTAGAWSTVSASGANEIGGMNADRRSSTYTPRAGGASTPIWRENELAGCWLHFDDEVHPITDNRGGRWSSAATSAQPHIRTDSTDGITATNGAISIYPRDVMVLADIGIGATMAAVRVTFAAATHGWPDNSAWGCARVLAGGVVVLGDDPDWARARRTSVPVSTVTLPSGRVRPRATLPARREVDVAWTDGVDTMAQAVEASAPDWIGVATGADPMGDVGSTPYTLEGLLSRIQGEAGEVVLVRVGVGDLTDGGTLLLRRRHEFLHGRITSVVSLDAAQGEEDADQIVRVGTLTVREEV